MCSQFNIWQNKCKAKVNKRNRERHYKLIKGKTNQGDIAILRVTASKKKSSQVNKRSTTTNKITYWSLHTNRGDFVTLLLPIGRSAIPKLNWEMEELNNIINQMDQLQRLYFLRRSSWIFSKIDHITRHKASSKRYEKITITPWNLAEHYVLKLDINNREYVNS